MRLGRDYYEHGRSTGQRAGLGYRNGTRRGSAEDGGGFRIDYSAPQVAGTGLSRSARNCGHHLKGQQRRRWTGLADRDVGARSLGARHRGCVQGRSRVGLLLSQDRGLRDRRASMGRLPGLRPAGILSGFDIAYLFVDGVAERIRPGQKREPVLAAWGFAQSRGPAGICCHLMAGSKEDAETVSAFFPGHARPGSWAIRCWWSRMGRPASSRPSKLCFPPIRPPALFGPPHAEPSCQGAGRSLARVQGPGQGRLSKRQAGRSDAISPMVSSRITPTSCPRRSLASIDDFEACIAHLHAAGHPPPCGHGRPICLETAVCRGAPAPEDHTQCVWRESQS